MNNTTFAIYDDELSTKSEIFTKKFSTAEEALKNAEYFWNQKNEREQAACGEFFVGVFELDEDECCGDCIKIIKRFK